MSEISPKTDSEENNSEVQLSYPLGGVSLGFNNVFQGSIGNIAGGSIDNSVRIDASTSINYHQSPPEYKQLLIDERILAGNIVQSLDKLSSRFIEPVLMREADEDFLEVPPEFEGTIPAEFTLFFKRDRAPSLQRRRKKTSIHYLELLSAGNQQIIAPLGFGKTTLLLNLAASAAKRFLQDTAQPSPYPQTLTCLYNSNVQRLPLYIDLLLFKNNVQLQTIILTCWRGTPLGGLLPLYLQNGRVLLLIDGLHELPESKRMKFEEELSQFLDNYRNNQYILASRREATDSTLQFPVVEIRSFKDTQTCSLFQSYLGDSRGETLFKELINKHPELFVWMTTPYIAYMTAFFYRLHGYIPHKISEIVIDFVSVLFERDRKRGTLSDLDIQNIQRSLAETAFVLVRDSVDGGFSIDQVTSSPVGEFNQHIFETACELGILYSFRDNEILSLDNEDAKLVEGRLYAFNNRLLEQYFLSIRLRSLAGEDPQAFSSLIKTPVFKEEFPKFGRARLFEKHMIGEAPWDTRLPQAEPSKWFDGLVILLSILPERDLELIFNLILSSSALTAGELATQAPSNLPRQVLDKLIQTLLALANDPQIHQRVRITSLQIVGTLGDPRIGDDKARLIPGGVFQMGTGEQAHQVNISPFLLDTFPVTNSQYAKFIEAGGYEVEKYWTEAGWEWKKQYRRKHPFYWNDPRYNLPNLPVVGVSWFEADAYCQWSGKRLPNEAEWECVSTWDFANKKKKRFPTGDNFYFEMGNLLVGEYVFNTTPVGAYPLGRSDEGILDLVGNVWEWLSTEYRDYPYDATDGREEREGIRWRCLRGGSWGLDQIPGGICTKRFQGYSAAGDYSTWGFRCARDWT